MVLFPISIENCQLDASGRSLPSWNLDLNPAFFQISKITIWDLRSPPERRNLRSMTYFWHIGNLKSATRTYPTATKMRVYETLVLSALLYNSETWTLKVTQQRRLKVFEMACLRKIEGVTRRDRIRNEEICNRLELRQNILSRIQQRRLRYFGHINRMTNNRYPKMALNGHVHGQRGRGRPKKRWLDMIQSDCEEMGLEIQDVTRLAQDRNSWRRTIGELSLRASASPRH